MPTHFCQRKLNLDNSHHRVGVRKQNLAVMRSILIWYLSNYRNFKKNSYIYLFRSILYNVPPILYILFDEILLCWFINSKLLHTWDFIRFYLAWHKRTITECLVRIVILKPISQQVRQEMDFKMDAKLHRSHSHPETNSTSFPLRPVYIEWCLARN